MMRKPWEDQPWLRLYRAALLELNPAKLPVSAEVAEIAIRTRVLELKLSRGDNRELMALDHALCVLRLLVEHQRLRRAA